jgi:hypothetical protein
MAGFIIINLIETVRNNYKEGLKLPRPSIPPASVGTANI